jgi:hypothetical protein
MGSATEEPREPVTGDLEKASPVAVKDEHEDEYPPFAKVVVIMTAVYLATFLVALVRLPDMLVKISADQRRIEQSWGPPSQRSLTIFTLSTTLDGMQVRIFSPVVHFNSFTVESTPSTLANGSSSALSFYSRLVYANSLVPFLLVTY